MKEKLKVAFIHSEIRDYRVEVVERLSEKYDFSLILTWDKSEIDSYPQKDKWKAKSYNFFLKIPGTNRKFPPGIFPDLLRGNFDVVISSDTTTIESILAFFATKLRGKKFILWNELWDYPPLFRFKLIKPLLRFMTRKSDALIAAGSKARDLYLEFGGKPEKIFISPNCAVDYKNAKIWDLRSKFKLADKKVILYLGRIVQYKGLDVLLKAFSEIEIRRDDLFLVVGGEGPFEEYCRQLSKDLGLSNIKFVGFVSDVASYIALSDLFVLPARFMHDSVPSEAWGLVLNEVMSMGKPVIATDAVAGAFDLIEDGKNGFMVENQNVSTLRDAIEKIISDDLLRQSMGDRSREIIEESFTYDKMFKGFVDAIDYVMDTS
ncbi:MAG: glycosyltransferase family 4 protein [Methanobacteriota archaeon]